MAINVENINLDLESIKSGTLEVDGNPEELRIMSKGTRNDEVYLFALEQVVNPATAQQELEKLLSKNPGYKEKLLINVGACLEKDRFNRVIGINLLDDQKGIWRLLESDYHMEVYSMGEGLEGFGGGAYKVYIRNSAYEQRRLAPIAPLLQALDNMIRSEN